MSLGELSLGAKCWQNGGRWADQICFFACVGERGGEGGALCDVESVRLFVRIARVGTELLFFSLFLSRPVPFRLLIYSWCRFVGALPVEGVRSVKSVGLRAGLLACVNFRYLFLSCTGVVGVPCIERSPFLSP